jgi:nicotinate-nucleotide adenylyltransferase
MDTKDLQKKVDETFKENFGYTPDTERTNDITREFFELMRATDEENKQEETGDLLCSLIESCTEKGWDFSELVQTTLTKINSRSEQYKTLGRKVKVAILGGSFNPIHKGHIQMAQFVLNTSREFDEVWLMPAYHHMNKELQSCEDRLEMCRLAASIDKRIKVFDYEIKNKLAGETFNFFKRLKMEKELTEKYQFSMIIGLDNANSFDKWVNFEELEKMVRFVVVPRSGVDRDMNTDWYLRPPHIFLKDENTGIVEASSTYVKELLEYWWRGRNQTSEVIPTENWLEINNNLDFLLSSKVFDYIEKNNLYK